MFLYFKKIMTGENQPSNLLNICDYIISRFSDKWEEITNLKLQKLLYYAQWRNLAINWEAIFEDQIEARINGPVCPNAYHHYKHHGSSSLSTHWEVNINLINNKTDQILIQVLDIYWALSPWQLVAMTHAEGPWKEAREWLWEYDFSSKIISRQSMQKFFKSELAQND